MKENEYYFTTPDHIYGLTRKTLIFVVAIKKKIFTYKVADWGAGKDDKEIIITEHYPTIYHGKLDDSEYFCNAKCYVNIR